MREEIDQRPLVVVFFALCVGLASVFSLWHLLFMLPLGFLTKRWTIRFVAVATCFVGFLIYPDFSSEPVLSDSFVEGEYDVITMPQSVRDNLVAVVEGGGSRYLIEVDSSHKIVLGDRIKVRANLVPLSEGQLARRGAVGKLQVISEPAVVEHGSFIWRAGLAVRGSFKEMIALYGNDRVSSLIDGLCFSMTSEIPQDFRTAMSRTGTSHIVATSGLHVVLTTFALALLLGTTPIPRGVQLFVLLFLLAVYAAAAGLRPPVIRAVLMAAVMLTTYLWRRSHDGLSAVAFAGIVSLLWSPETINEVGFQLSMVAVFSLVLFAKMPSADQVNIWSSVKAWGFRYAQASVIVTLATAPLLAYHFGLIPIVSVPANLLVVPVLGFVISGALSSWLIYLVIPSSGVGLLKIGVEPLTGWIAIVIEKLGALPFASVPVPDFSAYWIAPFYLCALLLWRPHVRTS